MVRGMPYIGIIVWYCTNTLLVLLFSVVVEFLRFIYFNKTWEAVCPCCTSESFFLQVVKDRKTLMLCARGLLLT